MATDWIQSITIIFLFSIFLIVDSLNGGVQSIQKNWNLYRCNPVMMPLAGFFAPPGSNVNTQDNFQYCIQTMMATFAPSITQPFSYLQSMTVDMMGSINDSLSATTEQSSWFRFSVANIFGSLYEVFLNIIVEFNIIVVKMLDTQGKLSGIITTLMYIMTAVQYTLESMWNGIPGDMLRTMDKANKKISKMKFGKKKK